MRSSEMSPGNPNMNEAEEVVRAPRAGQWLKGSEWSQERLPSVASFMRQMLTGAFVCQAQRGVWSCKGAQPPTPSLVGRETMTALMRGPETCTRSYKVALGKDSKEGKEEGGGTRLV